MDANIVIAAGFPHELLGLLRRMPGIEDLNLLQDSERFINVFKEKYYDKTEYIKILDIACKLGIVVEMSSIIDEPMWRRRSFINKAIIQLMSDEKMKEYQACEILESFMQIFGWDFEVKVARRWQVTEEDSTDYHKAGNANEISASDNKFEKNMEHKTEKVELEKREPEKTETEDNKTPDNSFSKTMNRQNINASKTGSSKTGSSKTGSSKTTSYNTENANTTPKPEKIKNDVMDHKRNISDFVAANSDTLKEKYEGVKVYADEDNIYDRDEYIKNEILKGGIKFENLMTNVVRRDVKKAIKGNSEAQYRMGKYYAEPNTKHTDYEEALKWYRVSASQGNKKAQFELGMLYDGGKVKCIDYKNQAFKCYLGLAESGFPTAQCMLGMKYKFGDGVEEDINEAIRWFKKAAAQGHVDAQRNLGDTYMAIGKKEDAMKWYGRAAAAGDGYSEKMLSKK